MTSAPELRARAAHFWGPRMRPLCVICSVSRAPKCAPQELVRHANKNARTVRHRAFARRKILSRYGDKHDAKRWDFSTFTTSRIVRALLAVIEVLCFCVRLGYYRTPSSPTALLNRERHACIAPAYLLTILNDLPGAAPGESLPALPLFLPVVSSPYFFGAHHDEPYPESGPA